LVGATNSAEPRQEHASTLDYEVDDNSKEQKTLEDTMPQNREANEHAAEEVKTADQELNEKGKDED